MLGLCWGYVGAMLGLCWGYVGHLGAMLGYVGHFDASWGVLEPNLGAILAYLGASWRHLGGILGASWGLCGGMLAHVGAFYVENVVKSWIFQKHCKIQCFLMIFCVSEAPCWSKNLA